MQDENDLQANGINEVPDLSPVELPGRNNMPTVEDRLAEVEKVLNIS